jgi:hypothetical protein
MDFFLFFCVPVNLLTRVAEQVDAQDLKSCRPKGLYGFDSRPGYTKAQQFYAVEPFVLDDQHSTPDTLVQVRWQVLMQV